VFLVAGTLMLVMAGLLGRLLHRHAGALRDNDAVQPSFA
jgi:hypothetical protein